MNKNIINYEKYNNFTIKGYQHLINNLNINSDIKKDNSNIYFIHDIDHTYGSLKRNLADLHSKIDNVSVDMAGKIKLY